MLFAGREFESASMSVVAIARGCLKMEEGKCLIVVGMDRYKCCSDRRCLVVVGAAAAVGVSDFGIGFVGC